MDLLIQLGGREIAIHDSIFNVVVVTILLIIFAIIVNKKIKEASIDDEPSTFLIIVELLVEGIQGLVKSTMGEHNLGFTPYIFTLLIFWQHPIYLD